MLTEITIATAIILKVTLTILTLLFVWSIWTRKDSSSKDCEIPGPELIDIINGHLLELKKAGSFHEYVAILHQNYGPIVKFYMSGEQFIISTANHEVFQDQKCLFDRPFELFSIYEPLLTRKCIQYTNKEEGIQRRQNYNRHFSYESICIYEECIQQEGDRLCLLWNESIHKNSTKANSDQSAIISITQDCLDVALNSIIRCCFGEMSLDCRKQFKTSYNEIFELLENRLKTGETDSAVVGDGDFDKEFFDTKQFLLAKTKCYAIVQQLIDNRKESKDDKLLFLDYLMQYGELDGFTECDALAFIIGGFHTSGYALVFLIYYLATHSHCQQRLREEIVVLIEASKGENESLSWQSLRQLPYLRCCIDETLRLSQLAPIGGRVSEKDENIGGYTVPANTPILHALGVALMDSNVFPQPNEFKPERFEESTMPPFAFEPFGFGRRKCPGYRFAYLELSIFIAKILQTFQLSVVDKTSDSLEKSFGLITKPKNEIFIKMKRIPSS